VCTVGLVINLPRRFIHVRNPLSTGAIRYCTGAAPALSLAARRFA
jgi:hypothetical protein